MHPPVRDVDSLLESLAERDAEIARLQALVDQGLRLARTGEVAGVLIHELNQPLFVVSGHVDMRREGMLEGDGGDRAWAAMGRASEKAATLVRTLRNVAVTRLSAPEPYLPAAAVALALRITSGSSRVVVSGVAGPVRGSVLRMAQAVAALLENALLATTGPIEVLLDTHGPVVTITVRDGGSGVPEALVQTMYRPLTTAREGASGLGLPVAARIARDHGGELRHEARPGGGADFVLSLPVSEP